MNGRFESRGVRGQTGFSMIEVLVTMVIVAFGLLGLAGFITRGNAMGIEANQRARALALLEDMAERIRNNKSQAASYVSATERGSSAAACAGLSSTDLDLCEWNNVLYGTNDALTSATSHETFRFRGCVTQPYVGQPVYVVTIAWGSTMAGTPPADTCGAGAFGNDAYRRIVRTQIRVATLSA